MPSTETITSSDLSVFSANTTIKSAEANGNINIFRGHSLPVDPNTSAAIDLTYDIGGSTYQWRYVHAKPVRRVVSSSSATVTGVITDEVFILDCTSNAITLDLPTAASNTGKFFEVIKTDSTVNAVTVDPNGAETINGDSTTTLNTQYEAIRCVSDGTNWVLLERIIPSIWTAYTPTVGNLGAGSSTNLGKWRRIGDSIEVRISVTKDGTPGSGASAVTFGLPTGASAIDAAKTNSQRFVAVGLLTPAIFEATTEVVGNTTNLIMRNVDTSGNITGAAMTAGTAAYIMATIPITGWKG